MRCDAKFDEKDADKLTKLTRSKNMIPVFTQLALLHITLGEPSTAFTLTFAHY